MAFSLLATAVVVTADEKTEEELMVEYMTQYVLGEITEEELMQKLVEDLGLDEDEAADMVDDEEEEPTETVQIEGLPAGFTFTTPMGTGARGEDVKYLQIFLNADPATQLAGTGAGSPGNETEYYGPITAAAVTSFQNKHAGEILEPLGLSVGTGYFGNSSIAHANAMLEGGEVETPKTELDELREKVENLITVVNMLKEMMEDLEDPEIGPEGELSVSRLSAPRNIEVGEDQEKDVAGFELEAEDSDVTVSRVDLTVDGGALSSRELAKYIDTIGLYVDGEVMGEVNIETNTIDRDHENRLRMTGLEIEVEEGETVDVMIKVAGASAIDGDYPVDLSIREDGIRYTDEARLTKYAPEGDEVTLRSFELVEHAAAEVEWSLSSDTPEEGTIVVEDEDDNGDVKEGVELLLADVEVKESQVEWLDLGAQLTLTNPEVKNWAVSYNDIEEIYSEVALYVDGEFVEFGEIEDGLGAPDNQNDWKVEYKFEDLEMVLDEGEYEFSLRVDIEPIYEDYQGMTVTADLVDHNSADTLVEDTYDYGSVNIDGGDLEGEEMTLYIYFPEVVYADSNVEKVEYSDGTQDRAEGYIEFEVSAHGGDAYFIGGDGVNQNAFGVFTTDFTLDWIDVDSTAVAEYEDAVLTAASGGDFVGELAGDFDADDGATEAALQTADKAEGYYHVVNNDEDEGIWYYSGGDDGTATDHTESHIVVEYLYLVEEGDTETFTVSFASEDEAERDRIRITEINWVDEDYDGDTLVDPDDFELLRTGTVETFLN